MCFLVGFFLFLISVCFFLRFSFPVLGVSLSSHISFPIFVEVFRTPQIGGVSGGLEDRVFDSTFLVRGKIEASVLLQLLLIRVSFVVVWYYSGRSVKILNPDCWEGVVMLGRSRVPIT